MNGYFPSLTVKSILNGISDDILDIEGSFSSTNEQIQEIMCYRFYKGEGYSVLRTFIEQNQHNISLKLKIKYIENFGLL